MIYVVESTVAHFMNDLNHIVNPILYFFSGRRFRRDAIALLHKGTCRKSNNNKTNSGPTTITTTTKTE